MKHYKHLPSVLRLMTILLADLPAEAAIFKVDKAADDASATACNDATPSDCSLRGAILAANALSEPSTINVPAGTYVLSQSSTCTFRIKTSTPGIFTSSQIPLCLSKDITLQGAGANVTTIDGDKRGRVLFVSVGVVAEVRGMTLRNGNGGPTFFSTLGGGGILNHGTLTLTETVVSGNTLPSVASQGGGIENLGTLSLRRSAVMNNGSVLGAAGGGIHNEGFYGESVLMVSESTISGNVVGAHGGGISNGATVTIINSTISGNTATNNSGGGIANLHAGGIAPPRLTMVNSTISGNTSGTAGGGIAAFVVATVDLNNVTITNNTAGTSSAASRSGGGINNSGPTNGFTLQNTIIAGNRDLGLVPAPDCFSEPGNGTPMISRGYNLIQDIIHCTLLGDTTGNITGVDPQLGQLLENGGLTRTHAVADDSPALDAGNPAAPGSGGTACTALDQRGFNRLQDADGDSLGRCDIGAFELTESAVGFSLSGVRPNAAGNTDSAYALIYGSGFVSGMTVRLARAGEADIVGSPVTVDAGGAVAATSFALAGRPPGLWDVVITNPDGASSTVTGAFTITPGGAPQIWSDVVGPDAIRVGRPARFTLFVGNRGNLDARAVPVRISLRSGVDVRLNFPVTVPPFQPGQVRTDWSQTPLGAPTVDNTTNILLLLPILPAGFTTSFEFSLTASQMAQGQRYEISATVEPPFFAPDLDPELVTDLVAGARTYAQEAFGVSIPPELAPDLEVYVIGQLEAVIANGRNALVASVGAQSQIYSRAQLVVDLGRFGAVLAGAEPPAGLARNAGHDAETTESTRVVTNAVREAAGRIFDTIVYFVHPNAAYGQVNPMPEGTTTRVTCSSLGGELATCLKGNQILGIYCLPKGSNAGDCGGSGKPFIPVLGRDPNDKTGAQGVGAARSIPDADALRYTIAFENLETASAAAQEVIITDQLDASKVDLATFSLGPIAFGDRRVTPPPGLSRYSTSVDLRPALDLILAIDARLDQITGLVTWHFLSLDPLTGQFTEDPIAGFLPPNVNPPEGDGSVAFTIAPKVTNVPICNQASIIFDVNDAILTPEWCNTIDDTPPSSQVAALAPTQSSPTFDVDWSGIDTGSGIADYTIFVSENGGPFMPFVSETTSTSTQFTGNQGSTYAFYSVARDLVGNMEAAPATADAQTIIEVPSNVATETPTATPANTATPTPTEAATDTPTQLPTPTATQTPPAPTPSPTPPPSSTACGDINDDGRVTLMDVLVEAMAVLVRSRDSRFDVNQDGRVSLLDLAIVVSQLGRSC